MQKIKPLWLCYDLSQKKNMNVLKCISRKERFLFSPMRSDTLKASVTSSIDIGILCTH